MKLLITFTGILLIATLVTSLCIDAAATERNKSMISSYKDSVGQERAKLLLIRYEIDLSTDNSRERMNLYADKIDERTAINKRIYGFQWKIDSLQMVLNK